MKFLSRAILPCHDELLSSYSNKLKRKKNKNNPPKINSFLSLSSRSYQRSIFNIRSFTSLFLSKKRKKKKKRNSIRWNFSHAIVPRHDGVAFAHDRPWRQIRSVAPRQRLEFSRAKTNYAHGYRPLIERVSPPPPPPLPLQPPTFLNMAVSSRAWPREPDTNYSGRRAGWMARGAWKRQVSRGTSAANSYLKVYRSRDNFTVRRIHPTGSPRLSVADRNEIHSASPNAGEDWGGGGGVGERRMQRSS